MVAIHPFFFLCSTTIINLYAFCKWIYYNGAYADGRKDFVFVVISLFIGEKLVQIFIFDWSAFTHAIVQYYVCIKIKIGAAQLDSFLEASYKWTS